MNKIYPAEPRLTKQICSDHWISFGSQSRLLLKCKFLGLSCYDIQAYLSLADLEQFSTKFKIKRAFPSQRHLLQNERIYLFISKEK